MINSDTCDLLNDRFPLFRKMALPATAILQQVGVRVSLPAGKVVFAEGDHAGSLALLLSGGVRVFKAGKTGREITLYRFTAGESCILTANAILNHQPFPANATVEQAVEAVVIPEDHFRDWVQREPVWQEFVFGLLSMRLISVLSLVDDVVFRRMDVRVASLINQLGRATNPILMTHQEIADELGSSREVISRILEGFALSGWIRAARGTLEVLDFPALDEISSL